jgi:hypothetical protein
MAMRSLRTGRKLLVLLVFGCCRWLVLVALLRRQPGRSVMVVRAGLIVLVIAFLQDPVRALPFRRLDARPLPGYRS